MCITIEKPKTCYLSEQYEKEVELMRKRISTLLYKVEENPLNLVFTNQPPFNYHQFKESLKNIDHENLKK